VELVARQLDYWVTTYRRTWRGSTVTSFVMPLLFLTAMGVGLGGYVDDSSGPRSLGGVSYLAFIAPGLLATTAMQIAILESTYPVFGNIKWTKVYSSMIATPLRVVDVLNGHLLYVAFRLAQTCAVFLLLLAVFGVAGSVAGAVGAWPARRRCSATRPGSRPTAASRCCSGSG
jgi:lipooligosaccharide transport system permease protein